VYGTWRGFYEVLRSRLGTGIKLRTTRELLLSNTSQVYAMLNNVRFMFVPSHRITIPRQNMYPHTAPFPLSHFTLPNSQDTQSLAHRAATKLSHVFRPWAPASCLHVPPRISTRDSPKRTLRVTAGAERWNISYYVYAYVRTVLRTSVRFLTNGNQYPQRPGATAGALSPPSPLLLIL
jgi:hypothetical protein